MPFFRGDDLPYSRSACTGMFDGFSTIIKFSIINFATDVVSRPPCRRTHPVRINLEAGVAQLVQPWIHAGVAQHDELLYCALKKRFEFLFVAQQIPVYGRVCGMVMEIES